MKPKLLKVITPNKMIFIKGRLVRSPFESIVKTENQLSLLKKSLHLQGASYVIEDYIKPQDLISEKIVEEEKPVTKKQAKKEPKTILEKFANDEDITDEE